MWDTLTQFTSWWWRSGSPYEVPKNPVKRCAGSVEFVLFRRGMFQVEQVILFPGFPVPAHAHPNLDTYETHLTGTGQAWLNGAKLPEPNYRRGPRARRLLIKAGEFHSGEATEPVVTLSFQKWNIEPTFISDNWIGEPWK